jgi:uncharacterized glyoxalase superfamily protein PhnB
MSISNSNTSVQPYLFFGGRCEEALDFYRNAVGAEVQMLTRFKESPEPHGCRIVSTTKSCMQPSESAKPR